MSAAEPAVLGAPDLDDGASLLAADRAGLLPGAAGAGAQVRAAAADVAEAGLDRLGGAGGVRSVVLLARSGTAARAAQLVVAAVGPRAGVPVLHLDRAPRWLGPLDVVVAATDDAGDLELAASVALAVRRGAEVVLAAPADGPVAAAGAGRAVLVPPRVPVPPGLEHARFTATALAVLAALGVSGDPVLPLDVLADELDRDAERHHPAAEVFANPAKALAARLLDHAVVVAGEGPAALAVAAHAADQLLLRTGRPAAGVELGVAVAGVQAARSTAPAPDVDPFFHDPQLDGPAPAAPARVVVLVTGPDTERTVARASALPDADLVGSDVSTPPLAGDPLAELLLLVPRLETAAVLLGLVAGPGRG